MASTETTIKVNADTTELTAAIEQAEKLCGLLERAAQLSGKLAVTSPMTEKAKEA